jgi:transcription initiation factor TFIID TATA-box-binding protein
MLLAPRVQNVVATCSLGTALFLPRVAKRLCFGEYNPSRFSAYTYRITTPKSTALIFGTGKIVCTGTKSRAEALWALYVYTDTLRRRLALPHLRVFDAKVQNMVSSANVGFPVDLGSLARAWPRESSYEPRLFPGLIYRQGRGHRVVFLVFASGRVVITGARAAADIPAAFLRLMPVLLERRVAVTQSRAVAPAAAAVAATTARAPARTLQTLLGPADAVFAELVAEGLLADVPVAVGHAGGGGGYKGPEDTTFVPENDAARRGGLSHDDPDTGDA